MSDIERMAPESGKLIGFGVDYGPLVDVRLAVSGSIWRIGPAWAVFAGALASGLPLSSADAVFRLVAAILLADSAWGLLWRVATTVERQEGAEASGHRAVPYAWPGSPLSRAAQILRGTQAAPGTAFHGLAGGMGLTVALSALLGVGALALSLAAAATALAVFLRSAKPSTVGRGQNGRPAFCHALLNLGLPWVLGMNLGHSGFGMPLAPIELKVMALAGSYFLLQWGILRGHSTGRRGAALWGGQVATLVAPVGLKLPIGAAIVAALSAPPVMVQLGSRPRSSTEDGNARGLAAISWGAPWWWASMMVTALAVRLAT